MDSDFPLRQFLGIHRYGLPLLLYANITLLHATVFPLDVLRLEHLRSWWQKLRDNSSQPVCCAANAKRIEYLLSTPAKSPHTGRATILIVGGTFETMESLPGTYRTIVKKRKGFVKLALKHGTPLVPVLSFGETDLYNQVYSPKGSTLRRIQDYIRNIAGLPPVIFWGRGFFQYSFGLIPNRLPVTVVVGSPLELPKIEKPTAEQIDEYHKKFVEHLIEVSQTIRINRISQKQSAADKNISDKSCKVSSIVLYGDISMTLKSVVKVT
ncbi:Diacylglycerol O-acyltransferase [Camponotus floridanus]|uniref:Diacylglycerol O-acyltransferase n=1 Tax=Camponotus floridanus TaxID=104421 RepID=E2AJ38_CAMFO|nr:Diacylglycerol O-acyltransferase [Camponotus floridanus]